MTIMGDVFMKVVIPYVAVLLILSACKPQSTEPAEDAKNVAVEASVVAPDQPAAVPPPTGPVTPSFDCAKAESEAEKLVCSDYSLAAFDNRLADIYAAELAKTGASKDLAPYQRGWVKERDDCWKADDKKLCVEEAYRTRIAYLQINSPGAMAATAVEFKCNDISKPFTMAYYNDYDNKPAIITLGNDQAIIFPQLAASGAKYGRMGIDYWEHQGKASVDFYGVKLECTPVPASTNL